MAILVKYQTGENVVSGKIPEEKRTISGSEILAVLDSISAVLDGKHASVNFFAAHVRAQVMDMHMCAHTHMCACVCVAFPFLSLPAFICCCLFVLACSLLLLLLVLSLLFSRLARMEE